MIYEKFPQLHALTADEKKTLAAELLREAAAQNALPQNPTRTQASAPRLEPAWKQQARDAANRAAS
jgi:hypothetical protein